MHEGVYAERSFWVKPEIGSLGGGVEGGARPEGGGESGRLTLKLFN